MVKLNTALSKLTSKKILVAGDLMLDTYIVGVAERISPEAPVAVVHVSDEHAHPGGAGNVMLNLKALGAEVIAFGRVGNDAAGKNIHKILSEKGIDTQGILTDEGYQTPVKNRVVANSQQIVRIDYENIQMMHELYEERFIEKLNDLLNDVSLVAISDYGKGFLTETLLSSLIEKAKKRNIFVITDPKGCDYQKYRGTDILKPNEKEAYTAAKLSSDAAIDQVAAKIHRHTPVGLLMITRSQNGISTFYPDGRRQDFPVQVREVKDVTGAGDTVLATLALSNACGLNMEEAIHLSNVAAGIAVERFGCWQVNFRHLTKRLLEVNPLSKVFDDTHYFALIKSLEDQPFHVISLEKDQTLTSQLYTSLKEMNKTKDDDLLIYFQDEPKDEEIINILCSLSEVAYIVIGKEVWEKLKAKRLPKSIYRYVDESMQKIEKLSMTRSK